ncbi:hypothetical protein PUT24_10905 [Streptomyces sp. SP17KL33]|nr:hypothetical protein [Streptomyces sp. SP17KL33]
MPLPLPAPTPTPTPTPTPMLGRTPTPASLPAPTSMAAALLPPLTPALHADPAARAARAEGDSPAHPVPHPR